MIVNTLFLFWFKPTIESFDKTQPLIVTSQQLQKQWTNNLTQNINSWP